MKSVIFNEGDDIAQISSALFEDESDPRSNLYKRKLIRPHINWLRIVLFVLIPLFLIIIAFAILSSITKWKAVVKIITLVLLLINFCSTAKKAIICIIKIYQRYAPEAIRNKCRFEPSCSEYMIIAIEKYGLIKGLRKGFDRLHRCNINDGGYDYP